MNTKVKCDATGHPRSGIGKLSLDLKRCCRDNKRRVVFGFSLIAPPCKGVNCAMTQSLYIASGIFISALIYWFRPARPKLPFPPGPPKHPLIGNLLNFPLDQQWLTFLEWGKEYGRYFSRFFLKVRILTFHT
jgi:hypothetical protein